ncbi:glycosyltransferase family 4 protein [Phormidium yuhuli AB48]|uniref:Glycosyltransferase family 4 protein n=1 Tax=Phormidium yuhuli AB48 TaxID=2940671 RepID=A0ABY5AVT7_9CYAN|nr:glycosyltransferase family 4 protein [Phormidium yuhuli]USR92871.1 glycosyltransferase family 4 protein [Phormidium yuhuli AB48]
MNVLSLSATFPYPPSRGGTQVRTFNLLKYLNHYHPITLVTQRQAGVTDEEIEALRSYVSKLVVFDRPPALKGGALTKAKRFASFFLGGRPPSVLSYYSREMQAWVDEAVNSGEYEVITCEHSVNETFVRPNWGDRLKTVVNVHSSIFGTCQQQLETETAEHPLRDRLNLPLLFRYENRYCQKFSHIVVTTPEDGAQMKQFNPDSCIMVIPNGVDVELFPMRSQDPGGHRLTFVGAMDNIANIDAVTFLVREIYPQVRSRYPETTLTLVGSNPVAEVQQLGQVPGVTVTGRVPSMTDYLHQATVCVVSMRIGYGIKNKTLEAMAAGTPVVGSDAALEGLEVDGETVPRRALRANHVAEYVESISHLFENETLRQDLSQQGRSYIEEEFTWQRAGQLYERAIAAQRGVCPET